MTSPNPELAALVERLREESDRLNLRDWNDDGAVSDLLREAAALLSRPGAGARQIVEGQANDEGLWFVAQTAPESYLQAALRRLHAAVESSPTPDETVAVKEIIELWIAGKIEVRKDGSVYPKPS